MQRQLPCDLCLQHPALVMLVGMTVRLTVSLPDDVAAAVREAAGNNVSGYAAHVLKEAVLREQIRSLPSPDPAWTALAEEARGW
jgi:hypothetical protein